MTKLMQLSYRLRYLLAWDGGLSRIFLTAYVRVIIEFYRHPPQRGGGQ